MNVLNVEVTPKDDILSEMKKWLTDTLGDAVDIMLPELAEMFLENGPEMISDIYEAISNENGAGLKNAAHSIKGSCASMGVVVLADHLQMIENCGKNNNFETAASAMPYVEAEYNQVIDLFKELV